jgi:hypothetical protein
MLGLSSLTLGIQLTKQIPRCFMDVVIGNGILTLCVPLVAIFDKNILEKS